MLSGGKGHDPAIIPAGVESLKMKHLTEQLFIYMVLYSYVNEPDRKKEKKKAALNPASLYLHFLVHFLALKISSPLSHPPTK